MLYMILKKRFPQPQNLTDNKLLFGNHNKIFMKTNDNFCKE